MIEKLLDWLYDFSLSPNAGAWEAINHKKLTKADKVAKFKKDLKRLIGWRISFFQLGD